MEIVKTERGYPKKYGQPLYYKKNIQITLQSDTFLMLPAKKHQHQNQL